MSRRYQVTHLTTYTYDDDVTASFGLAFCRPRDGGGQTVVEHELWTDPGHADLGSHLARSHPSFDPRAFGHSKLSTLVREQPWLQAKADGPGLLVALKGKTSSGSGTAKKSAAKKTASKKAAAKKD